MQIGGVTYLLGSMRGLNWSGYLVRVLTYVPGYGKSSRRPAEYEVGRGTNLLIWPSGGIDYKGRNILRYFRNNFTFSFGNYLPGLTLIFLNGIFFVKLCLTASLFASGFWFVYLFCSFIFWTLMHYQMYGWQGMLCGLLIIQMIVSVAE